MYTHTRMGPHCGLFLFVAVAVAGFGQKWVPTDWSNRHVVFSNPGTEAEAIANGTHERWLKITHDPRYAMQQAQRQMRAGTEDPDLSHCFRAMGRRWRLCRTSAAAPTLWF